MFSSLVLVFFFFFLTLYDILVHDSMGVLRYVLEAFELFTVFYGLNNIDNAQPTNTRFYCVTLEKDSKMYNSTEIRKIKILSQYTYIRLIRFELEIYVVQLFIEWFGNRNKFA